MTVEILEYLDARGRSPYASWFNDLNANAAAKITAALYRVQAGNLSNVEGVGEGVVERKIDFGGEDIWHSHEFSSKPLRPVPGVTRASEKRFSLRR